MRAVLLAVLVVSCGRGPVVPAPTPDAGDAGVPEPPDAAVPEPDAGRPPPCEPGRPLAPRWSAAPTLRFSPTLDSYGNHLWQEDAAGRRAVVSLDRDGGTRFKTTTVGGAPGYLGTGFVAGRAVVRFGSALDAVDAADGSIAWRVPLGALDAGTAELDAVVAGPQGPIYAALWDGLVPASFVAIDPVTGQVLWTRPSSPSASRPLADSAGNLVYSIARGGSRTDVFVVAPSGVEVWQVRDAGTAELLGKHGDTVLMRRPGAAFYRRDGGAYVPFTGTGACFVHAGVFDETRAYLVVQGDCAGPAGGWGLASIALARDRVTAMTPLAGEAASPMLLDDGSLALLTAPDASAGLTAVERWTSDGVRAWVCELHRPAGAATLDRGLLAIDQLDATSPAAVYDVGLSPAASGWVCPQGDFRNAARPP